MDKKKADAFVKAALPLMKWLEKNANPPSAVIVSASSARLVISEDGYQFDRYLPG